MNYEKIDKTIHTFLEEFNEMCRTERRDFLIRERLVNYESGSSIKKYNVTYRVKRKQNTWTIEAVSNGFWIFRRKFLLLKITPKKNNLNFTGLYTTSIRDFEESLLSQKLKDYLNTCKKLPHNAFVRS
ncbi:hypothetical protein GCM10022393_36830 [Aquimarina addita]|uniref:Uncharacterized protein n=1 Tax=Aquimarina addita TaxID=870485 RepID=A0ABP6URC3_9FLAO